MKIKLTLDQIKNLVNEGKLPYRFLEENKPEDDYMDYDGEDASTLPGTDYGDDEKTGGSEMSADDQIRQIKGGSILDFLQQMPKRGSFGYIYYTAPVSVNKFYIDDNGEKQLNPMNGKLFKNTVFKFQFDKSYKRAVEIKNEKTDDNYEVGARQSSYKDVEGYNMLLSGKSGLYFPIVLDDFEGDQSANYTLMDEAGGYKIVSKDEIRKYLKPVSGTSTFIDYRSLIVQRVFEIRAGGRIFNNSEFPYKYLGPKNLQK
jgi:hypothetical protein